MSSSVSEPAPPVVSDQDQTSDPNQAPPVATEQAPVATEQAAVVPDQAPVVQEAPNQAPPAATEQAPVVVSESTAAPVVSVPEEAITAMYQTIIAIAKFFHDVDPKDAFNALTAKGVPNFEDLKKAFTRQILVDAEKQRIAVLLLKTDGSDLGKTTFDKFLKLAPTPAPAPVAAHDENAVAPDVSEPSASSASAPDVSEQSASSASSAPAANAAVTPAPVAAAAAAAPTLTPASAAESQSKPDESIASDAAPAPAPASPNPSGGSKKKRSQTKRKNGHHHHISRNRKARA